MSKSDSDSKVSTDVELPDSQKFNLIEENMAMCIKLANLLFVSPFTSSTNNQLQIETSQWYKVGQVVTGTVATISVILKSMGILRAIKNETFDMGNRVDPFLLMHSIISMMCVAMHMTIAFKSKELLGAWQGRSRN